MNLVNMNQNSTTHRRGQSAAQKALHITEILEHILLRLDRRDILCNAQAVSHFWRNCINGSQHIKMACLLVPVVADELTAEDKLYMKFVDPLALVRMPQWAHDLFSEHLGTTNPSLADMRKFLMQDPIQNFYTYRNIVRTAFDHCWPEINRFDENCGPNAQRPMQVHQLRREALHPFIRHYLWPHRRCYWSGYGSHAHLSIHGRPARAFEGESGYPTFHAIITTTLFLIRKCPTATWIGSTLTTPAVQTLTVCGPPFPFHEDRDPGMHSRTYYSTSGVTIRDALLLIVDLALELFALFAEEKYQLILSEGTIVKCDGDSYVQCEATEEDRRNRTSELRERMQPACETAQELQQLLTTVAPQS